MSVTVGQMVEWIVKHRRGKAFNYDVELIQRELCHAISNGVFAYHEVEGEIQGVVCGRAELRTRTVHIYDILTTKPGVLKKLMERFLLVWPDYKLDAQRHGRLKTYNNPTKLWATISIH